MPSETTPPRSFRFHLMLVNRFPFPIAGPSGPPLLFLRLVLLPIPGPKRALMKSLRAFLLIFQSTGHATGWNASRSDDLHAALVCKLDSVQRVVPSATPDATREEKPHFMRRAGSKAPEEVVFFKEIQTPTLVPTPPPLFFFPIPPVGRRTGSSDLLDRGCPPPKVPGTNTGSLSRCRLEDVLGLW